MFSKTIRKTERPDPYQQLHGALILKYGMPELDFALRNQLALLREHFPDPSRIANLRILDLGCGCARGAQEIDANLGTWSPWLCRAIQISGGTPVGVDIGSQGAMDTFEFHRINLLDEEALSRFEDHSFDGVSCSNLFSSSHLVYRLGQSRDQRASLVNVLKTEVKRLLKPSGIILEFDERLDNH